MTTQTPFENCQNNIKRRIVLAEVAGFCFGVRRAVDMVNQARQERTEHITMLGPLVHNAQVVERMRVQGVETENSLENIRQGTVVLSAHGVAPKVRDSARERGLTLLDVTCPFVTKVHRTAKQLIEQGYELLLVGDHGHTEVKGVVGAVEGKVTVVSTVEEVKDRVFGKKVGILSQTTQKAENYAAIVAEVARRVPDVRAINTICGATDELQAAAVKLAREADVVIVIGGQQSANTRRLRETCEKQGVPAYQIETAADIQEVWLADKTVIGLTAGASTPDWLIEEVAVRLNGGNLPDDWELHHPDE